MVFKPSITAIVCALGVGIVTVQAGEQGGLRDPRIRQSNNSMPRYGINTNQLAADARIMARIPGGHEAYGWRYPDAFKPSPDLMRAGNSRLVTLSSRH
jgi:hypothetical protein